MSFLRQRRRQLPPVLLLLLIFPCLFSPSTSNELDQLLKLKASLETSNPTLFSSWKQELPTCNFTGIVCNSNGLVSEINLSQQNLSGSLPFDAICSLPELEKLSFGSNFLHGSLTEDLRKCTNLHELDLANNCFTGEVPDLGSLSQLRLLSLNGSAVSGLFPWKSLENLTELAFLSLGDNRFDESSITMELSKLDKLYWLYLSNCSITGEIPEGIGNLTLLENLELSDNKLVGAIPQGITNLNKLWQLELYDNSLTGKIPVGFGNLTSLRNFDASNNKLEGDLSELKSLTGLVSLQLYENQLVGEVPEEFGEFKNLSQLSLYENEVTGSLPQKLGSWSGMEFIDVSENYLTGPIPPGMCKNERMLYFILVQNNFTGGIPESYADCKSLVYLLVHDNSLSGTVPVGIWSLPNVTHIDLSSNKFSGMLPHCVGNFSDALFYLNLANNLFHGILPETFTNSSLSMFDVSHNHLEGQLPRSLANCATLKFLVLSNNQFDDVFPFWLGSLPKLKVLAMSHNGFYGAIGQPKKDIQFPQLQILDMSYNRFRGEFPAQYIFSGYANNAISSISLTQEDTSYRSNAHYLRCSITITNKGIEIHYPKIQEDFVAIHISSNRFEGNIPDFIGKLKGLRLLNISNNSFTGRIPSSFGNLILLESLDLSQNQLSGQISPQLSLLSFLEKFDVSHNNLAGHIPGGNQFSTFDITSFEGNPKLCGDPLPKRCESPEGIQLSPSSSDPEGSGIEVDWKFALAGLGSGLVVGVVLADVAIARWDELFIETVGMLTRLVRRMRRSRR